MTSGAGERLPPSGRSPRRFRRPTVLPTFKDLHDLKLVGAHFGLQRVAAVVVTIVFKFDHGFVWGALEPTHRFQDARVPG